MAIKLDPEVVELCRAINLFAGLRTYSSCCGHGRKPLQVWIHVAHVDDLFPLLRAVDLRYGGPDNVGCPWKVEAFCTDLPDSKVSFLLSSRTLGYPAYTEAAQLATNLRSIASDAHNKLRQVFGIHLRPAGDEVALP